MPIWAETRRASSRALGLTNIGTTIRSCRWRSIRDWRRAAGRGRCARRSTLHDAGIQVILDVVLNHTGESDHLGPTVAYRDNARCGIGYEGGDLALRRRQRLRQQARSDAAGGASSGSARSDTAARVGGFRQVHDRHRPRPARARLRRRRAVLTIRSIRLRDLVHVAEPTRFIQAGRLSARHLQPGGRNGTDQLARLTMRQFCAAIRHHRRGGDAVRRVVRRVRGAASADGFAQHHRPRRPPWRTSSPYALTQQGERRAIDRRQSFWNHGVGPSDDPAVREARLRDVRALLDALHLAAFRC